LQDRSRLKSALAPEVIVDYTGLSSELGHKIYTADDFITKWFGPCEFGIRRPSTQQLLGIPIFKYVDDERIVVEWQQLAGHDGEPLGEEFTSSVCRIGAMTSGRSYIEQEFVKVDGKWKIDVLRPSSMLHGRRDTYDDRDMKIKVEMIEDTQA